MKIKNLNIRKKKCLAVLTLALTTGLSLVGLKTDKDKSKSEIELYALEDTTYGDLLNKLEVSELNGLDNLDKDSIVLEDTKFSINTKYVQMDDYEQYKIKAKDSINKLSKKFGVSKEYIETLINHNNIKDIVGEEIKIYAKNKPQYYTLEYIVNKGDCLSNIVNSYKEYNVTIEKIMQANNLENDTIYEGQKIKIPLNVTVDKYEKIEKEKVRESIKHLAEIEAQYGALHGIDVSAAQGNIDWFKVKNAGIDFAILKMFDSYHMSYSHDNTTNELTAKLGKIDDQFENNIKGCIENDIPFGIYIYTRAVTEEQAKKEAYFFLDLASRYNITPTYPIYYDFEKQKTQPLYDENGQKIDSINFATNNKEQVLKNFKAFAKVLEENNYYCGFYSSDDCLKTIDPTGNELKDYAIWIARYATNEVNSFDTSIIKTPNYKGTYQMYQFTQTGILDGISTYGSLDCSYCKVNYSEIIKKLNMNKPINLDDSQKIKTLN